VGAKDFLELKNALRNEFSRRSMPIPEDSDYSVEPGNGLVIRKEYLQKVFDSEHLFSTEINHSIALGDVILTNSMAETITYIQTLMSENIKQEG